VVGPFLAGPAAAVLVMLMILMALYQITIKHVIPLMGSALDRHLQALDRLVDQNREDHMAMMNQMKDLERTITSHGVNRAS